MTFGRRGGLEVVGSATHEDSRVSVGDTLLSNDICTSAAAHGGQDASEEPVNGASATEYGEFSEVSLAEIVVLIVVILVAKKSEKVLQSRWFSSSALVSSRSAQWMSSKVKRIILLTCLVRVVSINKIARDVRSNR